MAITLVQKPYEFTPLRQRLIVLATSDNTANTGFAYKVTVEVDSVQVYSGYYPPNPAGALIVDLRQIIEEYVYLTSGPLLGQGSTIHSMSSTTNIYAAETTGSRAIDVDLLEAWIVGGVLTDDPDTDGAVPANLDCVWPASYQYEDGYRPNPATRYAMTGATSSGLTDRDENTHRWDMAETKGFTVNNEHVFIPVFEEDYGVISFPIDQGSNLTGNNADEINIVVHKANGTTSSFSDNISPAADIAHFPVYPANIEDSGIAGLAALKPSVNSNWVAYSIWTESSIGARTSKKYVLYNALLYGQSDCKWDRVRLAWTNSSGAWDYFNFIKRNEKQVQVERRRYNAIAGNYNNADGDTAFTLPSYSRGLTETIPKVQRFIEITSDWISEGEFELLKWLVVSKKVEWVQDSGATIPVVVETNDYTEKKINSSKVYNVTMRLRYAHDLNV